MPPGEISAAARERAETLLRERIQNPDTPSSQEVRGLVYSLEADRTELEKELRGLARRRSNIEEARNRYADLYEFAPLGYVLLSSDGHIEDLNHTFADLVGVARESLKGKPLLDWVAPDDRETLGTHLRACRCDNAKVSVQLNLLVSSDKRVPVQLHTVADHTPPDDKQSRGYRMAVMDITELLREREEKECMRRRLQHLQKLESLVTMAGGVAHDFNNILTVIQGFTDLVRFDLPVGGTGHAHCDEILRACKRASELSSQMLAFTGQWDRTIQQHDPADMIRGMRTSIENAVLGRAPVEYALEEGLPPIDIDVSRIRQAMLNLVTNAVEALVPNRRGAIRIAAMRARIEPQQAEAMVWGDQLQTGDVVVFEVSDNGCGMDEVTRRKMFDPFFSTKFTGRGLGLCSVLGIVRAHNGGLDVVSDPARGTTVKIYLPPATCRKPRDTNEPFNNHDDRRQTSNIVLIVDDESQILRILERGLTRRGFTVLTAGDGAEAVHVFKENQNRLDAVLLDMTMPHMDGKEAFRHMRRLKSDVPVILTSGYTEREAMRACDEKGLAGFIPKPFTVDDVVEKLNAVIQARQPK